MDSIIFSILMGFVLGILFYSFDKKSGKKLYKKWYDISNKDKLNPDLGLGFVHGRLFGQKLKAAIILSTLGYAIGFLVFGMPLFMGVFYIGGFLLGLLISFYLANKILGIFSKKRSKAIEYIESIEKGEKKVSDGLNELLKKKKEEPIQEEKVEDKPSEEEKSKEDPQKEDDWRSGVKKFLDK